MRILILFTFLIQIVFAQEIDSLTPIFPVAKKVPYFFVTHGDSVAQPYNWMREKNTPDIINYLSEENTYGDVQMKSSAILQKKIFEEMRGLMKENHTSRPSKLDNYFYYSRNEEGKEHAIQCRKKDSLTAKEEIILDPNKQAEEFGYFQLSGLDLSDDHTLLAYSVNTEGGDFGTLCVKNIAKDSVFKDRITQVGSFILLKDNLTIYYLKKDPKTKLGNQLFKHIIGTDTLTDQLIFERTEGSGYLNISLSESKRFLFISTSFMGWTGDIYAIDLESDEKTLVKIITGEKGVTSALSHSKGDYFELFTNKNAPDYLIKEIEIKNLKNERILIPEVKGAKLNSYSEKGDYMIVERLTNGLNELSIINKKTKTKKILEGQEKVGVIGLSNELKYDSTSIEYSFTSLITPTIIFKYNLEKDSSAIIWRDTVPKYDPLLFKTERVWASSRDGKKIPIDLVYKKSLKRDGKNPLYITAYACYGMNQEPDFNKSFLPYLNRNFVCAIAHPRGESLLGKSWHDDGKMMKKQNTINDFVDCTQSLIDSAYTMPKKIVAQGGSAGGLLMGGVANAKPEIYGAIIADVPFVNTLEDMLDTLWPNIKYHFDEIGNPYKKKEYDYIKSYSPLHNIAHKDYPNMLVTNGYNDSRVPFWAAAQYVARLRDMKTDTNLLLLKTSMEGGHGGSSGRYSGIKEEAFKIAFAMQSVGVKEDYLAVSGKVVDVDGDAIPYANVFVEGSSNGTVTNFDGDFYLEIKGGQKLALVFQTFGFKKQVLPIGAKTKITDMKVVMSSESKSLEEVTVAVKAKNRGNEIIRKANAQMEHYDKMLDNYSVDIYIKGVERFDSVPKKLPAFLKKAELPDSNDIGLMYLSESVSRYNYKRPDDYKEEMLSSKVAGTKQGMSWNRVKNLEYNFYKNNLTGLSEKPFISPIADGGILLYKYHLESKIIEDGNNVYKIKVTPRNKAEAVFEGYVYINDKTWSIHSVDLFVTKSSGIEFLDTMYIRQTYGIVNDSISTPRSTSIRQKYKFFGFKISYLEVGSFYNYQFNKKFPKRFFQKQVFSVAEDAVKKDTAYWKENRPVVLTEEESKYYSKLDTVKQYDYFNDFSDSTRKKRNKVTIEKLLLNGYTYTYKRNSIGMDGLIANPGYNTIEGLKTELNFNFRHSMIDSASWFQRNDLYLNSSLRYGFSSKKLYSSLSGGRYNSSEQRGWNVGLYNYIYQFNESRPIMDIVNAGYSLLMRQNFMKLYEKTSVGFLYYDVLKFGPKINLSMSYSQRKALKNNEDWYLLPDIKDQTTSNNPLMPLSDSIAFKTNNAFLFKFSGSYTFGERFELIHNFRRVIGSRYPTVYWNFEQGIKALGGDVGFGRYQVGIGKSFKLGYWGKSNLDIIAGGFINNSSMYFMDYKHFNGNQTLFLKNGTENWGGRNQLNSYNALDYYSFSTNSNYIEIHYQHRFLGLFLTKFPLLNKLHLEEVAGFNGAYTSGNRNYQEIYVGIENIAKMFRIDFVANYKVNDVIKPLIRIGVKKRI